MKFKKSFQNQKFVLEYVFCIVKRKNSLKKEGYVFANKFILSLVGVWGYIIAKFNENEIEFFFRV